MWASSSFALLISSGTTKSTYQKKRKKKKEKEKSGPTISAINSCPKATYYHLRILSTCIACLMYMFTLNTAKKFHLIFDIM